ncbi:nucleotidyltransferase family protein [Bacillus sp. NEB1478]|uniref:nucleotidyltransferase domain-containing protein n=1 Tax=Bacillus sp. NEB1478 TaxID=3073816 RepID=UPI002873E54D|nr:nucleotidyltransferase family protein [Bacillus sp. NEB1478]WNB92451.1 nucleotidyltransferase family protein [Bacillus sp. NEB1478]
MKFCNVFSNISKELQLQFVLLKKESATEINKMDRQKFEKIDWEEFINLVLHHRTYTCLYPKIKGVNENLIPPFVITRLSNYYKRNTFQMLYLTAEMNEINIKISEKGIRILFLKGPFLATDLYGDISLRTSGDLDVLVPIEDLNKVDQLLYLEGYVKDDYIKTVLNDWKWRHHHVTYFHPIKKVKLEIHWRLNPGPGKEPSFDELWTRKRKSSITSHPIYTLGSEDLFLFLVSHGARHGWSRLRWLLDIDKILNRKLDTTQLFLILKKYHALQLAGQILILISELLNKPIKIEFNNLMKNNHSIELANRTLFYLENKVNLHTNPVPKFVSVYHSDYLFFMKTKTQKILFLLSFLFPYPEDKEILPLPKSLHFLYFVLRPFLWIWNKTRSRIQPIHLED